MSFSLEKCPLQPLCRSCRCLSTSRCHFWASWPRLKWSLPSNTISSLLGCSDLIWTKWPKNKCKLLYWYRARTGCLLFCDHMLRCLYLVQTWSNATTYGINVWLWSLAILKPDSISRVAIVTMNAKLNMGKLLKNTAINFKWLVWPNFGTW